MVISDNHGQNSENMKHPIKMKEGAAINQNLIMFDYDGVIVDSQDVFASSFLIACRACGYDGIQSQDQFMTLLDGNFYETLKNLGLSSEKIDEILGDAFKQEVQKRIHRVTLFDGIQDVLNAISLRNIMTVITSNNSNIVWQLFNREGITCFHEVVGAEVEKSKVKKIQKTMSRYPDLPAFYVGDTKGDMIEGKHAGAVTVAVTWGWHAEKKLREASPDYVVHSPEELQNLFP